MSQWHCILNGARYDPVSETRLREWIDSGLVQPDTLLWTEGLPDWAPAGNLFPQLFTNRHAYGLDFGVPAVGTGGTTSNAQLMARARAVLANRWGHAILACLLVSLLAGAGSAVGALVVTGPLSVGWSIYFLSLHRRRDPRIDCVFSGFRNFLQTFLAYLVMSLVALPVTVPLLLLLAVGGMAAAANDLPMNDPGVARFFALLPVMVALLLAMIAITVYVMLGWALTFYLMADNKGLLAIAALRQSWQIMRGRKWKLFCLKLRFLGWWMLCWLTCGLGAILLAPYVAAAYAAFYEDVLPANVTAAGI